MDPHLPLCRAQGDDTETGIAPPRVASFALLVERPIVVACDTRRRDEGDGALAQRFCQGRERDDASLLASGPRLHHLAAAKVEETVGVDAHGAALPGIRRQ